jgi:DHA1 family tetracycline resistance protein-like MFS transporter
MNGSPSRRRAYTAVFLTVLLDLIGFGMILPLLPFYAQELRATPFLIGVLFSSYSLAQLLFAPMLGRLSDRLGRRPVLLATVAASAGAHLLFALAGSFPVLLLARSLSGAAAANYGIAQAYLADITPPEERSRAMGVIGAAFGLGFVIGPAAGGLLAHFLGNQAVPLTAAGLSLLNLVLAAAWLPESLSAEVRGRLRERASHWLGFGALRHLGVNSPLLRLLLLSFLVMFCFSIMEATLALYCQDRFGFGAAQTSWLFAGVGVVLVIVQGGLLGRLIRRFGERRLILGGIALMAAGLALVPVSPTPAWLLGFLVLLTVGNGLHNPSTLGLLSQLTDEGSQGETIGLSRSFGALARTLGPAAGTGLFGGAGPAWPFWAAGALMVVALLIAQDLLRRIAPVHPVST